MDTLRGNFGGYDSPQGSGQSGLDDQDGDLLLQDEVGNDSPPAAIGADERRMQVRAYNFWAALLEDRNFPNVEDLDPQLLPDFGPHGVLLDFSKGIEDPAVAFLGAALAEECGANGAVISRLSDVPPRSLLSRITDHYMQIIANQAPIGFEAEFVNQRGNIIAYRGILLPFSSDDETIDFIFGVINWKEMADARTTDALLLEIGQALDVASPTELADWADGPGAPQGCDTALPVPSFGLDEADGSLAAAPGPSFEIAADQPTSLADWLAAAREQALEARSSEDRTRGALYEAIGRAHDFALAAAREPEEFSEMLADAGLPMQSRAPMTPLVKLVFGADYDKTRLTEYSTALLHAQRMGLGQGELGGYLASIDGGLKGVVASERALRRDASNRPARDTSAPRPATARKLRALAPQSFSDIATDGAEFALVMVRRGASGMVEVLGEVPADAGLVERAARKLAA
ncbi:hypothetical protein M3P36_03030 [Altererythrobacter sp. KTW20L]|uniref:PAS domain-containing protein n=1 Tax=Altererythrobacter sp. KTW20L TaxID=2942210 RepID=UPI0020BF1FC1|nr:hypothetical protein [Altererythrobacter sp. KTW20L]MCL6250025.1 hypothetical protein [Altererythrobacter sp. KTW20L]